LIIRNAALYEEFKDLIERSDTERSLQEFLERHPEIVASIFNLGSYYPTVFPKFRLADDFEPDFVMIGHRSVWSWDVHLIEIEPAVFDRPLFNMKRQSTGRLRDAEAQVTDWQIWMDKYQDTFFVNRALEKLKEVRAWDAKPEFYNLSEGTHQSMGIWYHIVIGRRTDFEGWRGKYCNNKWANNYPRVQIVTWDRLLDKVEPHRPLNEEEMRKKLRDLRNLAEAEAELNRELRARFSPGGIELLEAAYFLPRLQ
jgi:hypothetical protein